MGSSVETDQTSTDSSSPEYSENVVPSHRQHLKTNLQTKDIELKDFKPQKNG